MRFVKLLRFDGEPIWVNASRVCWLQAARGDAGGTDLMFSTDVDDFERVKECPRDVAALCLDPA